jgi:hypothetical protein
MARKKLSRRTVLRGLLGGAAVSVALPTLDIFLNDSGTALADGSAFPRRFGIFFWGNGMLPDRWRPIGTGSGDEWQLSEQLTPLAPHKDVISVVTGMDVLVPNTLPHGAGAGGFLSGARIQVSGEEHTFTQPTIDQMLAQSVGSQTRFRSLEVGVEPGVKGRSFNGPNSINPPETSPYALYQRLFGAGFVEPGEEPVIDPRIALRRSVLDAVMDDSRKLQDRVSSADRMRLEQHFDGVRDLELRLKRLQEDPPTLASCQRPEAPDASYPPIDGRPQLREVNRVMSDLVSMALACDQTRVFSIWFSEPVGNVLYPGATAGHHQLTHDEPGAQDGVNNIVVQIMQSYGDLLGGLRAVPEGEQTLLDHCAVLATSDVSFGRQHLLSDFPIIIGGSAGGFLRTNMHHQTLGENASKVMLTLLRSQGLNVAEFGHDEAWVDEGLDAIVA